MTRHGTLIGMLIAFWLVAGTGFVAAALRQKDRLNLSATAGGQMPYLVYAQHVAADGLFSHFGDRNRMPLVPVLASWIYDSDWNQFVNRASLLSIALSLVLLGAMAIVAYRNLSPLFATAFVLMVAESVFAPQASFLQADLAYYALFFCSWWAMARLIQQPTILRAAVVGVLLGLTYLTKASVLLAVPIFLGVVILRAVLVRRTESAMASPSIHSPSNRLAPKRTVGAAVVAIVVFLAVIFPYLRNNHERFGRYFYNVNTTFFVWCDSWSQAQRFAEKYSIDQHFPNAPPEAIPGPTNYWRSHNLQQIFRRITYGLQTLGRLTLESASLKYLLFLAGCAIIMTVFRPSLTMKTLQENKWPLAWSAMLICAYVLAYAWYVVVAYGDRFVLSLVPPILFELCMFHDRTASTLPMSRSILKLSMPTQLALVLIFLAIVDGVFAFSDPVPPPNFVRFYYDETHEELRRGNLAEAQRGMLGVLTLDPGFAAAHRDLGMMALTQGRHSDAIQSLSHAATLQPNWADVQNSLGSAFIQAGRLTDAIPVLERATTLEPTLAPAWYNLCGALLQLERREKGNACLLQLEKLSPDLAKSLRTVFNAPSPQSP